MPASNYKPRVVLQFNEYDFRHRKVLEILRSNKRHMTDLVVNAILHFISCPEVESEFSNSSAQVSPEDAFELGDMMAAFRK